MAQHTNPWSGGRYPDLAESTNLPTFFENIVDDYAALSCPVFASVAARNTAWSNWLAAGNTATGVERCFTQADGRFWRYDTSSSGWKYAGGKPPPIAAITAQNFWSVTAGHQPGAYTDASGLIHLVGQVQPTVSYNPTDGVSRPAFLVPTGYRPLATQTFPIIAATTPLTMVTVGIGSDGIGFITDGSTTSVGANIGHFLDGITIHPTYTNTVPLA